LVIGAFIGAALMLRTQHSASRTPLLNAIHVGFRVGERDPNFKLRSLDWATVKLSARRAKPVLLNFWATWCAPALRFVPCRSLIERRLSWMAKQVHAAGWSLVLGTGATFVATRFITVQPELLELLEAFAKMSVLLFLWCNLYFSIKQSQRPAQEQGRLLPAKAEALDQNSREHTTRFTVRTGSRIQIVPAEDVSWIVAAGDYSELHTRSGSHLLRETMNSLEEKLDLAGFARIHRSKIVNLARVLELRAIDNREYIVKLCDGSQHRSSRTYAARLERWLDSEEHGK